MFYHLDVYSKLGLRDLLALINENNSHWQISFIVFARWQAVFHLKILLNSVGRFGLAALHAGGWSLRKVRNILWIMTAEKCWQPLYAWIIKH